MDTIDNSRPSTVPLYSVASSQASADAIMNYSQIWASGCKLLGEIMAETTKRHYDETLTTWQAMGHVKTWKDAVELQTGYFRSTSEHSFDGAKRFVEASNKLTHDALARAVDRVSNGSSAPTLAN